MCVCVCMYVCMCMYITESLCCTSETNTTVENQYTIFKNLFSYCLQGDGWGMQLDVLLLPKV